MLVVHACSHDLIIDLCQCVSVFVCCSMPEGWGWIWGQGLPAHAPRSCLCCGSPQAGQASAPQLQQEHRLQAEWRYALKFFFKENL